MTAQKNPVDVSPADIAHYLHRVEGVRCNCDLDNWAPTSRTGHSVVCRIHRSATASPSDRRPGLLADVRASLAKATGESQP